LDEGVSDKRVGVTKHVEKYSRHIGLEIKGKTKQLSFSDDF